jgi:hypothetical protein
MPVAALVPLAMALVGGIVGHAQKRKAQKALSKLQRPEYEIPQEILRNQKMAEQAANEGLPSQQYSQAQQNIQRQQNRAISMASDRRQGLMALPGIQQAATDAQLNLDASDAQARRVNQQQLYGINAQLAGFKTKQWDVNKKQLYDRDYGYNMQLLGAGNQNLMGSIDKAGSAAGYLLGGSGGQSRGYSSASRAGEPSYYGGYSKDSKYSGFETGF